MTTNVCTLWDRVGDALHSERCPFELASIFCQKEEDEIFENCSAMLILDHLKGEKYESI